MNEKHEMKEEELEQINGGKIPEEKYVLKKGIAAAVALAANVGIAGYQNEIDDKDLELVSGGVAHKVTENEVEGYMPVPDMNK